MTSADLLTQGDAPQEGTWEGGGGVNSSSPQPSSSSLSRVVVAGMVWATGMSPSLIPTASSSIPPFPIYHLSAWFEKAQKSPSLTPAASFSIPPFPVSHPSTFFVFLSSYSSIHLLIQREIVFSQHVWPNMAVIQNMGGISQSGVLVLSLVTSTKGPKGLGVQSWMVKSSALGGDRIDGEIDGWTDGSMEG